jgi:Autotransporter beta-domain
LHYSSACRLACERHPLTYNGQTASTTRSELGAWFDKTVLVGYVGAATLLARAAWAHDWGNDRALSTSFLTLPTPAFVINGAAPPPDKALVSAGSELRLGNGWSFTGKFDGEFAPACTATPARASSATLGSAMEQGPSVRNGKLVAREVETIVPETVVRGPMKKLIAANVAE